MPYNDHTSLHKIPLEQFLHLAVPTHCLGVSGFSTINLKNFGSSNMWWIMKITSKPFDLFEGNKANDKKLFLFHNLYHYLAGDQNNSV